MAGFGCNIEGCKFGFIGAGKAGITLGAFFKSKGLELSGFYSRNLSSARKASDMLSVDCFEDLYNLAADSDVIIISTPDAEISNVWNRLKQFDISSKIICHLSGVHSSEIFDESSDKGAFVCSLHPMHAFASNDGNYGGLESAYFSIEGDNECIYFFKEIFKKTGNNLIILNKENKIIYHLCNVVCSNLILALISIASNLLATCTGKSDEDCLKALMPLIKANIENISKKGVVESLTGPIDRNDADTVKMHLSICPEQYIGIYRDLSKRLAQLAGIKHPERDYNKIYNILYQSGSDGIEKDS